MPGLLVAGLWGVVVIALRFSLLNGSGQALSLEHASVDDAPGEMRRAATLYQPGDVMPIDAVGMDLGQWPGNA